MMVDDLQGLEGAVGLRSLVLTFNELTSMEGLTCLTRLTCLDLSFNAISRIQALKVAPFTPASANAGMHVAYAFSAHMLSLFVIPFVRFMHAFWCCPTRQTTLFKQVLLCMYWEATPIQATTLHQPCRSGNRGCLWSAETSRSNAADSSWLNAGVECTAAHRSARQSAITPGGPEPPAQVCLLPDPPRSQGQPPG